jgi:hypothetical protein
VELTGTLWMSRKGFLQVKRPDYLQIRLLQDADSLLNDRLAGSLNA